MTETKFDAKRELEDLILTVIREDGSDLHLAANRVPYTRVMGELVPLVKKAILTQENMLEFASLMLTDDRREKLFKDYEVDFSYSYGNKARFRCNAFFQRGILSIAMRLIPEYIRNIEELIFLPYWKRSPTKNKDFSLLLVRLGKENQPRLPH